MIWRDIPLILMSICSAVMPLRVPATLKSMSPSWSSMPAMSVRMATLFGSSPLTRPMATPATEAFSGTPAAISASEPPHTDAIDARPLIEHDVAEDPALHVLDGRLRRRQLVGIVDRHRRKDRFDDLLYRVFARVLARGEKRLAQRRAMRGHQLVVVLLGVLRRVLHFELRLVARGFAQLVLQRADAPDLRVRGFERVEDDGLVDFARARFDHHDRVAGAGHDEVEVGQVALRIGRIDDDLSVE